MRFFLREIEILPFLFAVFAFLFPAAHGQTGPGGVGNAGGTGGQPANVIWLDAGSLELDNDDPVETWFDISGNENDAFQVDLVRQPSFLEGGSYNISKPVIRFNAGDNTFLNFTGNTVVGSDYTVFLVAARRSGGNQWVMGGATNSGANRNLHFGWQSNTTYRYHHWGNDYQNIPLTIGDPGTGTESFGIMGLLNDKGRSDRFVFQNNSFIGQGANPADLIAWEGAGVGGTPQVNNFSDIDVAEIIFYRNALNDAQLQVVNQYLNIKYGIAIDNDLYSPDPAYVHGVAGIGEKANGQHPVASSAGLYLSALSGLTTDDFVFASHNNAPNSSADFTNDDLPAGVERRFNRIWSAGTVNSPEAALSFSFSKAISDGHYPVNHENYVLLYRSGTSGAFSVVKNANGISGGDRVFFNLNSSELVDGYYTLGTADEAGSPLEGLPGRTWYTLVSGDWDDWEVWTLDPSGALPNNPQALTPSTSPTTEADRVVILTGRTVTVGSDNLNHASVTIEGRLDLQVTSGHSLGQIRGSGRVLMAANNFPEGDATHFVTGGQGEGTVVYYGGSYSLNGEREFYDMRVELDDPANVLTLLADYTVNGELRVTRGNLRINDDAFANVLNITVFGDVTVQAEGQISTGLGDTRDGFQIGVALPSPYHSAFHQFTVYGSFSNYGTVRFTNQDAPVYNAFTTNGGVTVRFAGATNSEVNLYGRTDFYNLIVEKGAGRTYMLTVYSDNDDFFTLFGPNNVGRNQGAPYSTADPEVRKALWIRTGTLKLTGNIHIPTLTEGGTGGGNGDYTIGAGAGLWLDGSNVRVYTTASDVDEVTGFTSADTHTAVGVNTGTGVQALSLFGEFRIIDGFFSTRNSAGFVFYPQAAAQVKIEGGNVEASQFRTAGTSGSGGVASYVQSGGALTVFGNSHPEISTGIYYDNNLPLFSLDNDTDVFIMSGGELILQHASSNTTPSGLYIPSTEGNYNVTGGNVLIDITDARAFEIGSSAPVWDLEISRRTGTATATVRLTNDLKVLNNLTINANILLDVQDDDDATDYDLYIGRNFDLQNGGDYDARTNTTHFIGTQTTNIYARNNATPAPLVFNNVNISKDQNWNPATFRAVTLGNTGRSTDPANANNTAIEILGNLKITRGEFNTFRYKVSHRGNTEIVDGRMLANATNPGRVVLNGAALQTLKGSPAIQQNFGNIELANEDGARLLSSIAVNNFYLNQGIMDLGAYNLDVTGSVSTTGTFGADLMFQTSGSSSDGGLTLFVDEDGSFLFPVGTGANADVRYTPLLATFSDVVSGGSVTLSVDDRELPTLDLDGNDALSYSWRIRHSGFASLPEVDSYVFTCSPNDYPGTPWGGNWRPGKVVGIERSNEGGSNLSGTNITFNSEFSLEEGSYTAAQVGAFTGQLRVFYSRGGQGMKNWNDNNSWSFSGHTGGNVPSGQMPPGPGDIVVVGYNPDVDNGYHWINMNVNNVEVAEVRFAGDGSTWNPRIYVQHNHSHNLNKLSGRGSMILRVRPGNVPVLQGDLGDFLNNDMSVVMYHINANGHVIVPSGINVFPNLRTEAEGAGIGNRSLSFDDDILVRRNFTVDGNSTVILHNGSSGNITVENNMFIGGYLGGRVEFPDTGTDRTFTVHGDLTLRDQTANNALTVRNATQSGLRHRLRLGGDFIHDRGTVNLFTNNVNGNNVVLELFGDTAAEYTRAAGTAPSLYRIVMNKVGSGLVLFRFRDDFTLNGPADGDVKALEMISGRLGLHDPGIDITLTSGGGDFRIPSGSQLWLGSSATVRASGNNTGVWLDGGIDVGFGSSFLLNEGTNNYIEYSSSGNASIFINSGNNTFLVGSQIRRSVFSDEGVLNFRLTHATANVVIGTDGNNIPENNRGVFEILNAGSSLEMVDDATLIIANAQNNPSFPAVYIDPDTYSLGAGSGIRLGGAQTATGQNIGLFSNIGLERIATDNSSGNNPSMRVWSRDIVVNDDITIGASTTLNADGWNITAGGDWINNGSYSPAGNTTFFSGTGAQQITGPTTFHNLVKDSENLLTINDDIVVDNEIDLLAGSIDDGGNSITVKGNVRMDIDHTHGGTGDGIALSGTMEQLLTGNGTFGRLTVRNSAGVRIPLGNIFSVSDALQLESGVLDIGRNLLVIEENASIIEAGAGFSESNMIRTNISFTDAGVRKNFPAIVPANNYSFTYPIGSGSKYTPVRLGIENINPGGWIRVKAADEMHPSISDNDLCPGVLNTENVLKYHWTLEAGSVSGFSARAFMTFYEDDFQINESFYNVNDYITARLLAGSSEWNKFAPEDFDFANRRLIFDFDNTGNTGINGDYTAGVEDPDCEGAIPDNVPAYISVADGEWNEQAIWAVYDIETGTAGAPGVNVPAGGPRGSVVYIDREVTVPGNYIVSYKTVLMEDGLLKLGATFGHRLGIVEGTGTLQLERGNLPAGVYDDFFGPAGGTIEFAGNTGYDVLSEITTVRNLRFSGTGDRRLPNVDFRVFGDMVIDGDNATLNVINEHDRIVRIEGDLLFNAGSFDAGIGSSMVSMEGAQPQIVSGDFTGSNGFWDFRVDNSAGVTLNGSIDIDRNLVLATGTVTTSASNMLSVRNASETAVTGFGPSAFVDGPMRKLMNSGGSFIFPVGDGSRYGPVEIVSASTAGSQYWEAQYYNDSPANNVPPLNPGDTGAGIEIVSGNEYWRIDGPPNGEARVRIRWDAGSLLPAMTDDRVANLKMVEWITDQWEIIDPATVNDGGINSGNIISGNALDLEGERFFTLASSEDEPLPTAGFVSTDVVNCGDVLTTLSVQFTGTQPWSLRIDDGTAVTDYTGITTPNFTFDVTPSETTTYTITGVQDATTGGYITETIYGDPVTVTVLPEPQLFTVGGGGTICEGDEIGITLSGSESFYTYELYENGSPTGMALPGTGSGLVFNVGPSLLPATYNYTVTGYRTDLPSCEAPMTGNAQVIVDPLSSARILSIVPEEGCEGCETVLTFSVVADDNFSFTLRREWLDDPSEVEELVLTDNPMSANFVNTEPTIYTYTFNSIWENQVGGMPARAEYVYSIVSFNVTGSACSLIEGDPAGIIIWKRPETGPQYHIPNTFGE